MAAKALEERVTSTSEAPAEEAITVLRDVVLGQHPNDADSVKAKEQVKLRFSEPTGLLSVSRL